MENHEDAPKTFSVSFRLQRTRTEATFVSVPVTADLMLRQADGIARMNVEELISRAIALGGASSTSWELETDEIQPHPVQLPPPGFPTE